MNSTRVTHQWIRWLAAGAGGLALVGLTMMLTPSIARPDVNADVRAGIYPDADAVAVGGGVLARMGDQGRWFFNPNVELALGDRRDIVMMSGDFHYDFADDGGATFWVGGGPAIMVVNPDFGDSRTDLGINALTGVGARHGNVRPFGQLRGTVADDSQITIAGGVRF
jgi:hypothetical protein